MTLTAPSPSIATRARNAIAPGISPEPPGRSTAKREWSTCASAPATATPLYDEALQRFERIQDGWGAGDSLLALGLIAGEAGQHVTARERLTRALAVFQKVGDIRGTLRIIEAAAHLAARDGRAERALTLAGAAAAARHTLATPLPRPQQERLEKTLDAARRGLAPQQAGAAWMHGWSLSADEAVALAFAE